MKRSNEIRALIYSQMDETARIHAQQVAGREGTFIERLRHSPFVWAVGFIFAVALCSKYALPWLTLR